MRTVINIPTYEERENLPSLLDEILATTSADVMVLDDGSPDGTGRYAASFARAHPRIRVVQRESRSGLASAYRDGLSRSVAEGYDRILLMEADFTHQPRHLGEMIAALSSADVVVGSRYTVETPIRELGSAVLRSLGARGVVERTVARGSNALVQAALALPIRDITSGFMGFRRHVLEALDPKRFMSEGPAFLIELKYRAHRLGFSLIEVPVLSFERSAGPSKRSHRALGVAMLRVLGMRLRGSD